MMSSKGKEYGLVKKMVIAGLIFLVVGSITLWYIFTEKFTDTSEIKADFTVNAVDLIHEFEKNDSLANAKYVEKIVIVNGIVSEIEAADTTINVKMVDTTTGSYIIFAFQKQNMSEIKKVEKDKHVSIKGSCSGGVHSEILGIEYIAFKRCVINN